METEIVWLAPLLILPGIGLLINSTSSRFSDLHDEIHHWLDGQHDADVVEQAHLDKRARRFRNALVSLYASVLIFTVASLCGAVLDFMSLGADVPVFVGSVAGVALVVFAAVELIRESTMALEVISSHVDHVMTMMDERDAAYEADTIPNPGVTTTADVPANAHDNR